MMVAFRRQLAGRRRGRGNRRRCAGGRVLAAVGIFIVNVARRALRRAVGGCTRMLAAAAAAAAATALAGARDCGCAWHRTGGCCRAGCGSSSGWRTRNGFAARRRRRGDRRRLGRAWFGCMWCVGWCGRARFGFLRAAGLTLRVFATRSAGVVARLGFRGLRALAWLVRAPAFAVALTAALAIVSTVVVAAIVRVRAALAVAARRT